jgi:glycosyltransferase involved in cell wall biosynthesis
MSPRVSVCIPIFNGETYLRECVNSVLAQTFRDFEVLLVDDHSGDHSEAIAREYCARDSRVRYTRNDLNFGLVGNWNKCAELAKGEWIKFVFQDDIIAPNCLEAMLSAAVETRLIACRRSLVFEDGTSQLIRDFYFDHQKQLDELIGGLTFIQPRQVQLFGLKHLGFNFLGEPTAVMIHRSVAQKFGLFNPALIMLCDTEYWTRVGIHTGAVYLDEELASFRVHSLAMSANNFAHRKYRTMVLDRLVLLHEYIHNPVYEPVRRRAQELSPPIDLKGMFAKERQAAYATAYWSWKDERQSDRSLMDEHNEVSRRYPRIGFGTIARLWWLLKLRLSKRARAVQ